MSDSQPPRIIVCTGPDCNMNGSTAAGRGQRLYDLLDAILSDPATDPLNPPFKLRTGNCLDMCEHGPNLVIYPGSIRCNHVDEAELARILREYVLTAEDS